MKKLVVILAILMAASSFSACSQAENRSETTSIPSVATPSEIPERRTESDNYTETENTEKSPVSAFQEQSGTYPTTPKKADVSPTSPQQSRVSENSKPETASVRSGNNLDSTVAPKQSNPPSQSSTAKQSVPTAPAEKAQVKPTSKPTEAPKATQPPKPQPKPTEPPTEKKEVDYSQVVSNLIAYGQQLGMVYNGSLGIGNAGWFPPTDISSYTDTAAATAACYGDVDYVPYYYAGLGAAPSDIMFNVIASDGQIYVVYGQFDIIPESVMVRGFQIGDDNMYISAHISYDGKSAEIDFPVIDDLLNDILTESKMPTDTTLPFFVEDIHYPSELSMLNAKDINLDELNFLAKRLDSFTDDELEQFYVAAEHENFKTLKELINLTYNLDKFTVIKDVSDMAKVGRAYTLNTEGSVPADSRYDAKYAEIGRKLLGSGRGIFTEHGLLFVENKPMDVVYDGRVLPGFAYKDFIVNVDLTYKGRCESLFLPESRLAIDKAVRRLGAASIEDCECTYEFENPNYGRFAVKFEDILDNEGVGGLNALAYPFYTYDVDTEKLDAAIEMTGVTSSKNIITLINYLDDLELITDIDKYDFAGVGRYYLDQSTDLEISPDLLDFIDFEKFGEYIAEEHSGHFTSCGFLYYDGANYMSEIENALEDESNGMHLGGM